MKYSLLLFFLSTPFFYAQNYTEYATGSSVDLDTNHESGVCLMGGATENDEAMAWFLNKANGGDIVVLRASGSDGYNDYFYSELGIGINSVTTFVIANELGATDPYVLEKVANAEAIWFAGGDQFDYVSYFKNNAMEAALNNFINVKQGVIGGTSAGMAILGSAYFSAENGTILNAEALADPYHPDLTLGYNDFLDIPYLENLITDSHYDDPDRKARHSVFLARYAKDNGLNAFGIACNEYTAVCVDADGIANVFGEYPDYPEYAYFLQSNCVSDFMPENVTAGVPVTWNKNEEALKVYKVAGTYGGINHFNLADWTNGSGGTWENWYIDNGTFITAAGENPFCNALSITQEDLNIVSVYPNPFSDVIHIDSKMNYDTVEIFNSLGQKMSAQQEQEFINTSNWPSGIYILLLKSVQGQIAKTLIKT
ncbi:T9SS type A sorting domain-containing protein [Sediminibacter sp. Hel_I_10]|uniref:T9SS type A sorting domain-containing protein n=1 Tax=Sediminibacter sp. Hel_I_10 TaxID=1392490 RepID=UPI00047E1FAC|nr:T9SS type A sorting domain-containing protein [Sediminibacter sp. Hel_I_10]